jgi:hypothetical protein
VEVNLGVAVKANLGWGGANASQKDLECFAELMPLPARFLEQGLCQRESFAATNQVVLLNRAVFVFLLLLNRSAAQF